MQTITVTHDDALPPVEVASLVEQGWQDGFHQREPQDLEGHPRQARAAYFRAFHLGSMDSLYGAGQ